MMPTLVPGNILKLMNGMNMEVSPTSKHKTTLVQVTEILPADLDREKLLPKHGFDIKISDSSYSIYARLPSEQDDLVLSNKMQLGQFIYVDGLEPASPVPIIKGAKLLPGRHPLAGTPELIIGIQEKGERKEFDSVLKLSRRGRWDEGPNGTIDSSASSPLVLKPVPLDFDRCTSVKDQGKNIMSSQGRLEKDSSSAARIRRSFGGGLFGKSPALLRKSSVSPSASKFPKSQKACYRDTKIPNSCFNSDEKKRKSLPPSVRHSSKISSLKMHGDSQGTSNPKVSSQTLPRSAKSAPDTSRSLPTSLPGKLSILNKEALQHYKTAREIALQALRDVKDTETIIRSLDTFSNLSISAQADAPTKCFVQFLDFHQQIVQVVSDMVSIQPANETSQEPEPEPEAPVLKETIHNSSDQTGNSELNSFKRRCSFCKSIYVFPERKLGKILTSSSTSNQKASLGRKGSSNPIGSAVPCGLSNNIKLAKQIQAETGKWFMNFLEKALENGLKKSKGFTEGDNTKEVPRLLIAKVIDWIESEQRYNSKLVHPKTAQVVRKLRIKMKNP